MARIHACGVESTASIAKHPIHHLLIPFPIAFLIGALASDIVYLAGRAPFWSTASYYLLVCGFVMALVAAVFGFIDFVTIARVRERAPGWIHFIGNLTAVVLTLINFAIRSPQGNGVGMPAGIVLSIIVTLILGTTGWFGGELAYRYRVGMIETMPQRAAEESTTYKAA